MAKGAAWLVFARFAVRGIGLMSTVVLARLLLPSDFGLIAVATTLMVALTSLAEFSFERVLIREQGAGRAQYDTVWTLSFLRGIAIGALLVAMASPIAAYFEEPRLAPIMPMLALLVVMQGLQNVGTVDFQKDLQFHKDFVLMFVPKIGGTIAVIAFALQWRDYWALVAGTLVGGALTLALSYAMHPYRPRLSLAKAREVLHFSKWLLFNNVLLFLYGRMDIFFVGKLAGMQASGLYSVAYEISNLATTELVAPVRRAIFPGYAKLADDDEAIRKGYLDVLALTLVLALPIAAGIGLVAGPLVRTFLGASWLEAIPLIRVLAIYGIVSLSWANMGPLLVAIGRPRDVTLFAVVGVVLAVPLLYFGVRELGAAGAAWAMTFTNALMLALGLWVVLRAIKLPIRRLLAAVWRPLAATALMALAVLPIGMEWPGDGGFAASLAELVACSAVGAAVYVGALLGLWHLCRRPDGPERTILWATRALWRRSMPSFGAR